VSAGGGVSHAEQPFKLNGKGCDGVAAARRPLGGRSKLKPSVGNVEEICRGDGVAMTGVAGQKRRRLVMCERWRRGQVTRTDVQEAQ
jgi:hypothetical protein